jgi:hypothetical protein
MVHHYDEGPDPADRLRREKICTEKNNKNMQRAHSILKTPSPSFAELRKRVAEISDSIKKERIRDEIIAYSDAVVDYIKLTSLDNLHQIQYVQNYSYRGIDDGFMESIGVDVSKFVHYKDFSFLENFVEPVYASLHDFVHSSCEKQSVFRSGSGFCGGPLFILGLCNERVYFVEKNIFHQVFKYQYASKKNNVLEGLL